MNAAASAGDDSRMSRDTAIRFAFEIGDEAAADRRAASSLTSLGIEPADVVGLEDVGIDASS